MRNKAISDSGMHHGGRYPIRVLVDLKPALDGFAGIPQEARLLYRGLRGIRELHTEGLLQHGTRRLLPALQTRLRPMSEDRKINRLSRFVVSLYQAPHRDLHEVARDQVSKLFARHWMRIKAHLRISMPLTRFDSALFEDFVWRTFFSKTLNARDRTLLKDGTYRVLAESRHTMHKSGLVGASKLRRTTYPIIDTREFDYFLTQTPFPGRITQSTTMIVRYHDAVPILMPHTISNKAFHQASHFHALKSNVDSGAWFSCISEATRQDLLKIFPQAEDRTCVIHNMVSDEYSRQPSTADMVPQIVRNRLSVFEHAKYKPVALHNDVHAPRYLLMVSTIEPRKNHLMLLQAWEQLRYTHYPELKIIFVGSPGWDFLQVLKSFRPWAERGELFWLSNVPSAELRVLYQHAAVTVCPGLAEGFDYSGVEAMKCGGAVAASDIPVHREIYQDAAVYFDAYDVEHTAAVLHGLLQDGASEQLVALQQAGRRVAELYSVDTIMPKWSALFARLQSLRTQEAGSGLEMTRR